MDFLKTYSQITRIFINICLLFAVGETGSILFAFKDAENNAIIFEGETNLTMRCKVTESRNTSMKIVLGRETLADSKRNSTVLEHVIPKVTVNDAGYYTCIVTHDTVEGGTFTEAINLRLEVATTRPQCVVDDEGGVTHRSGETVVLSCYCMAMDNCQWSRLNLDDENIDRVPENDETVVYGVKSIVRHRFGPLTELDDNATFRCVDVSSPSSDQCSLGPFNVRPRDQGATVTSSEGDPSTPDKSPGSKRPNNFTVLIIVCVLLLVFFLGFLVFFGLCLLKRRKRDVKRRSNNNENDGGEYAVIETDLSAHSSRRRADGPKSEDNFYVVDEPTKKKPIAKEQSESHYEVPKKPRRADMIHSTPNGSDAKSRLLPDTPVS